MGIFYKSLRVGLNGREFHLLKLRTMKVDGGTPTASMNDPRLTKTGRWLRRFKLDELPTIGNLLKGDIVIVGPRPDVPSEYEGMADDIKQLILSVKPGLFSPATLWNIDEDKVLANEPDPHKAYTEKIKPGKTALNLWYVYNQNWWLDLKIICATFLKLLKLPYPQVYPNEILEYLKQ